MDKYKRYYGLFLFVAAIAIVLYIAYSLIYPQITALHDAKNDLVVQQEKLEKVIADKKRVELKLKKLAEANQKTQKKIFSQLGEELGEDSLFFVLYNDILEMIHSNSVKIRKMDYIYNPEDDSFVKHGKGAYFVCDINLELVSNYVNLGKLIQSIYQYPYYLKINEIRVEPYKSDKSVLITKLSLRLYAQTDAVIKDESNSIASELAEENDESEE